MIGAGSGGLSAARFAARLGFRVALFEKHRIGGDCTWTGCVPSKALIHAAAVAHSARRAAKLGLPAAAGPADLARVREQVREAISTVYRHETPERLREEGIDVVLDPASFLDSRRIRAGGHDFEARRYLICTGARPARPAITGLDSVPYLTYENIFDLDVLPRKLIVIGSGPIGVEMAQAFRRLGSEVCLVGSRILRRDEPEVAEVLSEVLSREGIRIVPERALTVSADGGELSVRTATRELHGDRLLVAAGRRPNVEDLGLERAGVRFSERGIGVDSNLRASVRSIYAAGDVTGGPQFTHLAGWQAVYAARNALLPGNGGGREGLVPWTSYTSPEVAHAGLTESRARELHGNAVRVARWEMTRTDRAVCEDATGGFVKLVHHRNGKILGATIVAARAGEMISEIVLAMTQGIRLQTLATVIHPYPTYATAVQELAAWTALNRVLSGLSGRLLRLFVRKGRWFRE